MRIIRIDARPVSQTFSAGSASATNGPIQDPREPLELRARPRPIRRLNRRALIIGLRRCRYRSSPERSSSRSVHCECSSRPIERSSTTPTASRQPRASASCRSRMKTLTPTTPRLGPPSPGNRPRLCRKRKEGERGSGWSASD